VLQKFVAGVCCKSVLQKCVAGVCCRSVLQSCVAVVCYSSETGVTLSGTGVLQ